MNNLNNSLFGAIKKGDIKIVKHLIIAGADVNAKNKDGYTPLHLPSLYGNKNIVKLLIPKKAKQYNIQKLTLFMLVILLVFFLIR